MMRKTALAIMTALALLTVPAHASDSDSSQSPGPVTLINAFVVPDGMEAEAIAFWERAADFMRTQPGYISTALHRTILPDARFELVNVAKWASADAFKKASHALRTRSGIKPMEGLQANPSLYTVIRTD